MAMHGCHAVLSASCNYFVLHIIILWHFIVFTRGSGQE